MRGDEFCVYADTTYPRVNATTILGTPETVADMTCWAQASVGRCPDCKERHRFLSVCLSQCDDDALMDIVLYNPPSSSSHLEPPRGTAPAWFTQVFNDEAGKSSYRHVIGPMRIHRDGAPDGGGFRFGRAGNFWTHALGVFLAHLPAIEDLHGARVG